TNTSWMFLGQIFSLLVSFFVGAWIARYLGPSNYGVLSYVLAFVGLFSFVASLGLDGILNRDLVAYPEKRDELLGTAFRLRLLSGGLTFFLILIISGLLNLPALTRLLIILYALIFIIQTPNIIANFF
ncbi:MAG: oligosaccharide flippase family protein, partial [Candidatus Falkowbacteria bacterium]|nr:oligosaccharide flippase family protein [Candidatus Falkowbacteria bacterium]